MRIPKPPGCWPSPAPTTPSPTSPEARPTTTSVPIIGPCSTSTRRSGSGPKTPPPGSAGAVADFDETLRLDPKNLRAREFRDDALARLGGRVREGQGGSKTPARK